MLQQHLEDPSGEKRENSRRIARLR